MRLPWRDGDFATFAWFVAAGWGLLYAVLVMPPYWWAWGGVLGAVHVDCGLRMGMLDA